jgi:hypothetical protein
MTQMLLFIFLGFHILASSGQDPQMKVNTEELTPSLIMDRIAKTSQQGFEVIEQAKRMAPEVQSHRSAKTLGEAVENCRSGRDGFIISPIGWEAFETSSGHWTISLYFKDEEQQYRKATWEYNQERHILIPTEFTNATKFWVRRSEQKRP